MATPPYSPTPYQADLYDQLYAWSDVDADHGWSLFRYVGAIASMFDQIELYARDRGDAPGWSILVDVDNCPVEALPWLAQLVGVQVTQGLSEDALRAQVKSAAGLRRGTLSAMISAIQATLTGTQTVFLDERVGGDAYHIGYATLTSETPDPDVTFAAFISQKPAGLVVDYHDTIVGGDYETLRDVHTDYTDVRTTFATYADVRTDPSIT